MTFPKFLVIRFPRPPSLLSNAILDSDSLLISKQLLTQVSFSWTPFIRPSFAVLLHYFFISGQFQFRVRRDALPTGAMKQSPAWPRPAETVQTLGGVAGPAQSASSAVRKGRPATAIDPERPLHSDRDACHDHAGVARSDGGRR